MLILCQNNLELLYVSGVQSVLGSSGWMTRQLREMSLRQSSSLRCRTCSAMSPSTYTVSCGHVIEVHMKVDGWVVNVKLYKVIIYSFWTAFVSKKKKIVWIYLQWLSRDVRFGLQLGQIGTKWNKSGAQWAKMKRKLILRSPRFIPFGANLAQLMANLTSLADW